MKINLNDKSLWALVRHGDGLRRGPIYVSKNGDCIRVVYKKNKDGQVIEQAVDMAQNKTKGKEYRFISYIDDDGKEKNAYIHRLVDEAFIKNPHPDQYDKVLHWDDDPSNNKCENLRWGTTRMNYYDSVRNRTCFKYPSAIRLLDGENETYYPSISEASSDIGVDYNFITNGLYSLKYDCMVDRNNCGVVTILKKCIDVIVECYDPDPVMYRYRGIKEASEYLCISSHDFLLAVYNAGKPIIRRYYWLCYYKDENYIGVCFNMHELTKPFNKVRDILIINTETNETVITDNMKFVKDYTGLDFNVIRYSLIGLYKGKKYILKYKPRVGTMGPKLLKMIHDKPLPRPEIVESLEKYKNHYHRTIS